MESLVKMMESGPKPHFAPAPAQAITFFSTVQRFGFSIKPFVIRATKKQFDTLL
jgi:hypothetical protein